MAVKIYNEANQVVGYEPGIIYTLVRDRTSEPFYVGETTDQARRLAEHRWGGQNADGDSELKYQFIAALEAAGETWSMVPCFEYGSEGPEELEDELIINLLVRGHTLTNERRGNATWLAERLAIADEMRELDIASYHEYRAYQQRQAVAIAEGTPSPRASTNEAWNRIQQELASNRKPTRRLNQKQTLEDPERLERIRAETLKLEQRERERQQPKPTHMIIDQAIDYIQGKDENEISHQPTDSGQDR